MDCQRIEGSRSNFRQKGWPEEELDRIYWRIIEKVGHPNQKENFYGHEKYGFIAWTQHGIPSWKDFCRVHSSLKKEMDLD